MDQVDGPLTRSDFLEAMAGLEKRLLDYVSEVKTEIVTAFIEFQRRNEARDATQEFNDAALAQRIAGLERRLLELEQKLLLQIARPN